MGYILQSGAVVVAQVEERSLLSPETRSSNPIVHKITPTNCNRKDEIIRKRGKERPTFKKSIDAVGKEIKDFALWCHFMLGLIDFEEYNRR